MNSLLKPIHRTSLVPLILASMTMNSESAETRVETHYSLTTVTNTGFNLIQKTVSSPTRILLGLSGEPKTDIKTDILFADSGDAIAKILTDATAEVGTIRLTITGSADGSAADSAHVIASATASWLDTLRLTVPVSSGLGFQNIFVNGFLTSHGIMSVVGNGTVSLSIRDTNHNINTLPPSPLASGGFSPFVWGFRQVQGNDILLPPPAQIPVRIGIFLSQFDPVNGVVSGTRDLGYEFTLDITANGGHGVAALATGDFGTTFAWGGITSIESSAGVPVTNYQISSDTNFNYAHPSPVPLPSTLPLLVAAVTIVAIRRRTLCHSQ
jgi:hypothetical protein